MKIVQKLLLSVALSSMATMPVYASGQYGDEKYQPTVGQDGKDVIWVPTGDELVMKMLETAKVTSDDIVYDLGAGDGKIPIAAASKFGARSVGIEYNAEMAELARRNAARAGVTDKVKIIHGDIFKEDFTQATVVTLYLLPDLNLKLRPTLLKMKPGTRIVSHAFTMGDWEADQKIETRAAHAYYWVVPADVAGNWVLDGVHPSQKVTLQLSQRFQRVGGNLVIGKTTQPLLGAQVDGDKLTFRYLDSNNTLHTGVATINGNSMSGEVSGDALFRKFSGGRR
jgi:hypothetical protein